MTVTNLPVLYSFRRCPYAMRARMALVYSDTKIELREVDLKNKPDDFLNVSPKATVPILILNNGVVLEESLDIIYWALSVQDKDGWLVLNENQKKLADLLINENDTEFKLHLDHYKYSKRFPEYSEIHYRQQGEVFLEKLNEILKNTKYLINDKLTLADIAIAPFVRQFSNVDIDWFRNSKYQLLVQWLDDILNSSLFTNAMGKYPVWELNNEKIIFP